MSLDKRLRKKFIKTVTGPISLVVILLWIFLAIFAVVFSADKTPLANRIEGNLALRPMGHQQLTYQVPNTQNDISFFKQYFWGKPNNNRIIPVANYRFVGNNALLSVYDRGEVHDTISIALNSMDTSLWKKTYFKTITFPLGSDKLGRDMLSQVLHGARVSILVGFFSLLIALFIGITLGLVAGFYGGVTDQIIQFFVSVLWTLPTFVLVLAFSVSLGKGLWQMMLAIGLCSWVDIARLVRGQVLSIKEKEYIQAAKILGFSNLRIMFIHILPVLRGNILIVASANFAAAILLEAGLSFLGMGVSPPTPSWGILIKENYTFITFNKAYLALIPGLSLASLVLSVNLLSNAMRDVFDERD